MKRLSTFMFAAAVAIIVSSTQNASAELITLNVVPPGGSFQQFNFAGPGPTFVFDNPTGTLFDGFRLTVPAGGVTEQVFVNITDVGFPGESFDVFVNGRLAFSTPGVAANSNVFVSTAALAFGNPNFSFGQFTLNPGVYEITINLRQGQEGGAFIQATPTPEPAAMLLLGTGLFGIAMALRKRRRQEN